MRRATATAYARSLDPGLPRAGWILQLGAFANAFGNGMVSAYLLIYLHNVRGISLGTAGLCLAATGIAAVAVGPAVGALVDRAGSRIVLVAAVIVSAIGFGAYIAVRQPWEAVLASVVAGVGNGAFWPANSRLIAALTDRSNRHSAYALQRVANNLGIGLGGLVGGLIATTSHPSSYTILFAVDAATFALFVVALAFVRVRAEEDHGGARNAGGYRRVLRDRVFLGFLVLDAFFVAAGFAWLQDLLPAFAKNHSGVSERGIGLIFLANTLVIVVAQLPVAKLLEGRRRMAAYALEAALWASAWLIVFAAGLWLGPLGAGLGFALAATVFGVGECLHGSIRGALLADLAHPALLGRYLALAAVSFQLGYSGGRAVGGFVLAASPLGLWLVGAGLCLAGGVGALVLERRMPREIRRTPARTVAAEVAA